ncbi:MAG: hypothetical protein K0Q72_2224 [Armatimonadetes bacterium]|nr:hypothetical protein [Armatimonadota bacterium]
MKRFFLGLLGASLFLGVVPAQALTSLAEVTPQNIESGTFRLTSKAGRNHTVEFVIRRDIRKIELPKRAGYLSNPAVDGNTLGKRVKLEQEGMTQTFRFSIPEEKVAGSVFTLWGYGAAAGEPNVTYQFHLDQFRKPRKD